MTDQPDSTQCSTRRPFTRVNSYDTQHPRAGIIFSGTASSYAPAFPPPARRASRQYWSQTRRDSQDTPTTLLLPAFDSQTPVLSEEPASILEEEEILQSDSLLTATFGNDVVVQGHDTADIVVPNPEETIIAIAMRDSSIGDDKISLHLYSTVHPMMPTDAPRYDTAARNAVGFEPWKYTVQPATRFNSQSAQLEDDAGLPDGWVSYIATAEGKRYFYNDKLNTVTENWMYDHGQENARKTNVAKQIHTYATFLRDWADRGTDWDDHSGSRRWENTIPRSSQLVLSCQYLPTEKDWFCGYYFACHEDRSLLWLEKFDLDFYLKDLCGVIDRTLIRPMLESQYWSHCHYFPSVRPSEDLEEELTEAELEILSMIMDSITSTTSTSTLSVSTLKQQEAGLAHVKNQLMTETNGKAKSTERTLKRRQRAATVANFMLARVMETIYTDRFRNLHGTRLVRMSRYHSIHQEGPPNSPQWFYWISLILLHSPRTQLDHLRKLIVDDIVVRDTWENHVIKWDAEWEKNTFLGTVLFAANLGFLSIQSVDNGHVAARALGFLSIFTACNSTVTSFAFARHFKVKDMGNMCDAQSFLVKQTRGEHGMEKFAIKLATSYAMVMWSILWLMSAIVLHFWPLSYALSKSAERAFLISFMIVVTCSTMIHIAWIIHNLSWKYGTQGSVLFPTPGYILRWLKSRLWSSVPWKGVRWPSFGHLRARWSQTGVSRSSTDLELLNRIV